LQQAKKQRDKERKDQELVNRKHLANVRVKQKNQVHVQGLTTKVANEDVSFHPFFFIFFYN
jgi:CCR4-NOT transcription complex subunit 4